jgi:non-homologous end joining protein Ku
MKKEPYGSHYLVLEIYLDLHVKSRPRAIGFGISNFMKLEKIGNRYYDSSYYLVPDS